jgi:hypothetical protein
MGYNIVQHDSSFFIFKENVDATIKAIKDLAGKETIPATTDYPAHYSFVHPHFSTSNNFETLMRHWHFDLEQDDDGNYNQISFFGEKSGDEFILLKAIAPYVEGGSYIEFHGEDGSMWRFIFDRVSCRQQYAKIVWE